MLTAKTLTQISPRQWLALLAFGVFGMLANDSHAQDTSTTEPLPLLSPVALEDLVARIALYPDELLAIVLPASTYPLQVVEASRFLEDRANNPSLEPDPAWDDAVVAMLNYPEALELLNDDLDWTWQLGEAVLTQQNDVLNAVENFRDSAFLAGNLETDERQRVVRDDAGIRISSAQPEVVYVPYYDPVQVIVRQPHPVVFFHDFGYPLYYYPFAANHRFNNGFFFGVSTAFAISWRQRFLHLHYFDHFGHPFFGRQFAPNRFFRHRSNRHYRIFAGNRNFARQGNVFRWYPGRGHGNSPRLNRFRADNSRRTLRYADVRDDRIVRGSTRGRFDSRNYRADNNVRSGGREQPRNIRSTRSGAAEGRATSSRSRGNAVTSRNARTTSTARGRTVDNNGRIVTSRTSRSSAADGRSRSTTESNRAPATLNSRNNDSGQRYASNTPVTRGAQPTARSTPSYRAPTTRYSSRSAPANVSRDSASSQRAVPSRESSVRSYNSRERSAPSRESSSRSSSSRERAAPSRESSSRSSSSRERASPSRSSSSRASSSRSSARGSGSSRSSRSRRR